MMSFKQLTAVIVGHRELSRSCQEPYPIGQSDDARSRVVDIARVGCLSAVSHLDACIASKAALIGAVLVSLHQATAIPAGGEIFAIVATLVANLLFTNTARTRYV